MAVTIRDLGPGARGPETVTWTRHGTRIGGQSYRRSWVEDVGIVEPAPKAATDIGTSANQRIMVYAALRAHVASRRLSTFAARARSRTTAIAAKTGCPAIPPG
ncbi:hypothetical protein GCM10009841_19880 [Microlunatus panaciterrae]|uniref:Uncharacterized protein n=1 Tax=Microlunatus panaciterrae TaxID=400768 RepID=A0ABS2RNE7_9ACTN|nr:hypothetical protein [Microlunatus panaciterrae]MBM7800541.1 hypothetical protein [Microlunatus panaciterrae]